MDFKVSHSAVADYLHGRQPKKPSEYVLEAFAEVFPSLTLPELRRLAGLPPGQPDRWVPPEEVHRLSGRQQKALTEMIRAIAAEQGAGDGDEAAPTKVTEIGSRKTDMQRVVKRAARRDPKKS